MTKVTKATKDFMGEGQGKSIKAPKPMTKEDMQKSINEWAKWWQKLDAMSTESPDKWDVIANLVGGDNGRIHPDDMPDYNVLHDFVSEWGDFIMDMQKEVNQIHFDEEGWVAL